MQIALLPKGNVCALYASVMLCMHSVLRNLKKSLILGHLTSTPADTYDATDQRGTILLRLQHLLRFFSFLFLSTSVFCLASRILSWPWD